MGNAGTWQAVRREVGLLAAVLALGCSERVLDGAPHDTTDASVEAGVGGNGGSPSSLGASGGLPSSFGTGGGSPSSFGNGGAATCQAECDAGQCPLVHLPDPRDHTACANYLGIALNHGVAPPTYTIGCGRILVTNFGPLSIQTHYWYDRQTGAFLGEKSAPGGPWPACLGVPQPDCPDAPTCTNCMFHMPAEGGIDFTSECTLPDGTVVPWEVDAGSD